MGSLGVSLLRFSVEKNNLVKSVTFFIWIFNFQIHIQLRFHALVCARYKTNAIHTNVAMLY